MMSSRPSCLLDAAVDRGLERAEVTNVDFGGHYSPVGRLDHLRGLGEVLGCRGRDR